MPTQKTTITKNEPTIQFCMDKTTDTLLRSEAMYLQYLHPDAGCFEHTIKYIPDINRGYPYAYGLEDKFASPENSVLIRASSLDELLKMVPVNLSQFTLVSNF